MCKMENENIKKGKKYLVIGVLVLFLAILGSSVAYYLARVQGSLSGNASGTGLDLTITPLSTSANATIDINTLFMMYLLFFFRISYYLIIVNRHIREKNWLKIFLFGTSVKLCYYSTIYSLSSSSFISRLYL